MGSDCIAVGAITYRVSANSWLSSRAAAYAVQRLWAITAGEAVGDFGADPVVEVTACDKGSAERLLTSSPGELPNVALADLLPPSCPSPIGAASLPAFFPTLDPSTGSPLMERKSNGRLRLHVDVVAMTFFMLTRWEETVNAARDRHGRFPASASLAFKHGFLQRPVVDEWALILRSWVKFLRPEWHPTPRRFTVELSHDVDLPLEYSNVLRVLRRCAGAIVRRHSLREAIRHLADGWKALRDWRQDPCFKRLVWLMDLAEDSTAKCAFFFMTAQRSRYDNGYDLALPPYHLIVEEVRKRGHEVGFHAGYETFTDPERFLAEKKKLDKILGMKPYGGRQHYLRFKVPDTWRLWASSRLAYDSTLAYAEQPGFRCGTCHPYQVYDVIRDQVLHVREVPLIVMDATLYSPQYCGMSPDEGNRVIAQLASRCRAVGGVFSMLIHADLSEEWLSVLEEVIPQLVRNDQTGANS